MKTIAVLNEFSVEAIRDALQKLGDFDKLIVNGLNAFQLNELEKIDPLLFTEIEEIIKADRWYPSVGMWTEEKEKISEEKLSRNVLYSVNYFKKKFGKSYRVFRGKKVYNNYLPQIIYAGRFDAAVLEEETEMYWLDSADGSRTLVCGRFETVDINDIDDEFINSANEFTSFENAALELFTVPLDLKTVKLSNKKHDTDKTEEELIDAEKYFTENNINKCEEIENAWISLSLGDEEAARQIIPQKKSADDFIKINSEEVKLLSYKFAEDMSADRIIRIAETAGKEKSLTVMCDAINAGFRCEIIPYEMQTFRVDSEGFVKEIFITE